MEIRFRGGVPRRLAVWPACEREMRSQLAKLLAPGARVVLSFDRRGRAYSVSITSDPLGTKHAPAVLDAAEVALTAVMVKHGIPLISRAE